MSRRSVTRFLWLCGCPLVAVFTLSLTWHYTRLYTTMEASYINLLMIEDAWANKTGILEIDGSIDLLVKANLYRVKCSKEAFGGGLAFKLLLNRNETLGAGIERIVAAYEWDRGRNGEWGR